MSKLHEAKHHVNVKLDMDEMDITSAESKATYEEIKKYVAEHNDGMKVTNLYIAQVKKKCGINLCNIEIRHRLRRSAALLRGRTIINLNQKMRCNHSVRRIRKRQLWKR